MSTKRIVVAISIFSICAIALYMYSSQERSVFAEQTQFAGSENRNSALQESASLTKAYRITAESSTVLHRYFGKDVVDKALEQPGCIGIRMYYGKLKTGLPAFVIVGFDNKGNETITSIIQNPRGCPPTCSS